MMNTRELAGNILTPTGWVHGQVAWRDGAITGVEGVAQDPSPAGHVGWRGPSPAENADPYILPGFVDLHVHGGGGADIMDGGDAPETIARAHARHGTTSLLATTVTAPADDLAAALSAVSRATRTRSPGCARVLGVHLEGPYINAERLGAQPNFARAAAREEIDRLLGLAPVRVLTLAPELSGHLDVIEHLAARGVRVQLGHTAGTYEDAVAALARGAAGFTHLFNAMTGLHHRSPGVVGAALAHAEYAEMIPDLLHVHPGAIRAALRAIPRLFCVTDATSATGMPDGEYRLGAHVVTKCLGGVRLADGTLAGSALTMDEALRNLVSVGLSIEDASNRLSLFPADYAGLPDRGRLSPGARADVVVLDRDLRVQAVYGEGEALWAR
jgi:N-acetylglucosamine-6-phosphate deacetylase